MRTEDFNFELDDSLIAQHPTKKRDHSRLLVMDRMTGELTDDVFYHVKNYFQKGDLLVVNDTRVIPARLFGHRPDKTEQIECLLLKQKENNQWECLVRPGKKMKCGQQIIFSDELFGTVHHITEDGSRIIEFSYEGIFEEILDRLGNMPLPPYITEKLEDRERYQTVYSHIKGSAAAPTAGLHFTEQLLTEIQEMGVDVCRITLHVGLGTFRPVSVENVETHQMHSEYYEVSELACRQLKETKRRGGKVIAVGTTSIRTLETLGKKFGKEIRPDKGETDIFIYPGFQFQIVDSLITNFHLPKSTLMMLVSAFSTKENIMKAYAHAIRNRYRFFSFGDAMLIKL